MAAGRSIAIAPHCLLSETCSADSPAYRTLWKLANEYGDALGVLIGILADERQMVANLESKLFNQWEFNTLLDIVRDQVESGWILNEGLVSKTEKTADKTRQLLIAHLRKLYATRGDYPYRSGRDTE